MQEHVHPPSASSIGSSAKRKGGLWIEDYVLATDHLPSSRIFRLWAAITGVAGVLEQKVWMGSFGLMKTYPHLYTILVGPPAAGKGVAIDPIELMWRTIPKDPSKNPLLDLKIAPTSMSRASLTDALNEARKSFVVPGSMASATASFNTLLVPQGELGMMMPIYDSEFLNFWLGIYDGKVYEDRKRTGNVHIVIEHPQLILLGGTTPQFLGKYFGDGTWDTGFNSRAILVFSAEAFRLSPFAPNAATYDMSVLLHDLKVIANMYGEMTWEPAAVTAYETWLFAGTPPVPEHPKLTYYNGRRPMHLQKLCMVASAARCSDRRVVLEDYRNALNWLLEAEAQMPEIFLAMAASSDSDVMNDVYAWMLQQYGKMDRPIPKHMMFNFIRERVPFHTVPKILSIMVQSRVAEVIEIEGQMCYIPKPKAEHRKI